MEKPLQTWHLLHHDFSHVHLFSRAIEHFGKIRLQMFYTLFKESKKSFLNKGKYNYAKKIPNLYHTYYFYKFTIYSSRVVVLREIKFSLHLNVNI